MNEHVLDLTQQAFDALGFELFDPSGRHVQSVKDLVVNANLRMANLPTEPVPLASDATLEEVFGFESIETYDVQRMFADLLDIIDCKAKELLPAEQTATGSKESAFLANKINAKGMLEYSLVVEEERREVAKLAGKPINGVKPTVETILEKRIDCRQREARLLIQFFKFIMQQLAQSDTTDKYKLAMDLRGIREALGACMTHSITAASTGAPTPTPAPDAPTSSRNAFVQAVHSKVKPVLLAKDHLTKKEDNRCEATHSKQSTSKAVAAQAGSTATSAVHPVRGAKGTVLIGDSIISSGGVLSVTTAHATPAAVSASKSIRSTSQVVQHESVGKKSVVTISYPTTSQNHVKILNRAHDQMMVVEYAVDDSSKPTTSKAINLPPGTRPTVPSSNIKALNPPVIRPVTLEPGTHARGAVNERDPKHTVYRAINTVRTSSSPQPNASQGGGTCNKGASGSRSGPDGNKMLPSQPVRRSLIKPRPILNLQPIEISDDDD
ncbi:uncharacterized protein LOC126580812 [Anopheles aquasalis]|uniref:uncharacterized protein LOC126580812 n=1 Tax=Anopheles aquasalis TaxID=42839 RepID=UPI00215AC02B|nr:uncharacterized protein LOC126580812 [Anopheles aquasalis]XP_050100045.1 uncharacterized protein LOC126580812 [Anopheles aquasalis]